MEQPVVEAINLLSELISTPSLSGQEEKSADLIDNFLQRKGINTSRIGHNIISHYTGAHPDDPYVLLCSHHDTVKPNAGYSRNPFSADQIDNKMYGLGSNDAGGALVSLIAAYCELIRKKIKINLVLAAVAEEETSGPGGVISVLPELPGIDLAIVGEPTGMEIAVAEKGLVVIDAIAKGKPGHAAHSNTVNPILTAAQDIGRINQCKFDRISPYLGETKASVTVIRAGELHNQVPAECHFVIDVRVNELYTLKEVVDLLQNEVQSKLTPRSLRLNPSGINADHKMLKIAADLGIRTFGSATLSDQALLPYPSIKMGPGDSLRSHTADEFIYVSEISEGINKYIQLIEAYSAK